MKNAMIAVVLMCGAFAAGAQVHTGDMAPEILLPNTRDSMVSLSSFRGKVVLIDFWASWCGPCRVANPGVARLYDKYKEAGFEVFGVSIDTKKDAWLRAIAQDHIKYTQVIDRAGWNSIIAEKYRVDQIPTSFLLDKNGQVAAVDLEGSHLENKVKQLLQ